MNVRRSPTTAAAVVGVLGGMGPGATVELMSRVLQRTPSTCDQDHIPILVYNNPHVPSRTAAVFENGPNPAPVLAEMARKLEHMGADFLALPCNSAHLYLPEIRSAVDIPVLSMIDLVHAEVRDSQGSVGLLATSNTLHMRLYDACLAGRQVLRLGGQEQAELMALIADVKAGAVGITEQNRCGDFVDALTARGADTVILGCTELSIVAPRSDSGSVIDPLDLLATEIVDVALGHRDAAPVLDGPGAALTSVEG